MIDSSNKAFWSRCNLEHGNSSITALRRYLCAVEVGIRFHIPHDK